jgi:two-component system OmpR family response regulator
MTFPPILIVDDDAHIRELLRYALEAEGLNVIEAQNGQDGLALALARQPQVIVLDVMMPEMNGLDMCRELRKTALTPVLFLSSRDSELDKILGLELGGDDYVSKPFSPRELVARIKAMLRRQQALISSERQALSLEIGHLRLNPSCYQAFWKTETLVLTTTEFNLLHTFLNAPQRIFTRDALIEADIFKDIISDRTIDSHIRRLRQKIANAGGSAVIETVHGFGYKLGQCQ